MTLVVSNLGKSIRTNFGVNELSSAITIGKVLGTMFPREQGATAFKPLSAQYGIRLTRLPAYLENFTLNRASPVLGERQHAI